MMPIAISLMPIVYIFELVFLVWLIRSKIEVRKKKQDLLNEYMKVAEIIDRFNKMNESE